MSTTSSSAPSITRQLVPEDQRMAVVEKLFGINFPMRLEPCIFDTASSMFDDYKGGFWEFYRLSNGGFYMAPSTEEKFHLSSPNGFVCELSGDATGLVCCIFSYSMLSFQGDEFAKICAEQFHLLREYVFEHIEVESILRACD